MNKITIPVALVALLIGSVFAWGRSENRITTNSERIEEVKIKQEKVDTYIMEQREVSIGQKKDIEFIKLMLQKIDRKMDAQ